MIFSIALLLLVVAALCIGFDKVMPTRIVGLIATGTVLVALVALVVQPVGLALHDGPLVWAVVNETPVAVGNATGPISQVLSIVLLGGGVLALLALALALAPTVRGFGNLFVWVLLALMVALLGLNSSGLIVPFAWAAAALTGFAAIQASGAMRRSEDIPRGLTLGLTASVLLLGGLLTVPDLQAGGLLSVPAALVLVLASLMYAGGAPFHSTLAEARQAPAPLGALLYGLIFPLLGMGGLLQISRAFPVMSVAPYHIIPLGLGLLSLLACAAGALREHGLRSMLAWLAGAQAGLVLLAVGLYGELALLAGLALLLNGALASLGGGLAVAVFEQQTGSDDFTQVQAGSDMRLPGLVWLLAGASALGIPAAWGFWGRYWLFSAGTVQAPWIVPPVLAASVLLALAYLAPLARFWWRSRSEESAAQPSRGLLRGGGVFGPLLLLLTLLLLALGVAPQLAWVGGLNMVSEAPAVFPGTLTAQVIAVVVAVLGLLLVLLVQRRSERPLLHDHDMEPTVLAPDGLAHSLSALAAFGHPAALLQVTWNALRWLGEVARAGMQLFERRYYLAGVLVALISLILLMAQG